MIKFRNIEYFRSIYYSSVISRPFNLLDDDRDDYQF